MAYVAKNWVLSDTVMPADMNKIEQGIKSADDGITSLGSGKVDKVTGKGLSEHDFTSALKVKLGNVVSPDAPVSIATGADLNSYTAAGYYRGTSSINSPVDSVFTLSVILSTLGVVQEFTDISAGNVYVRKQQSGLWSDWKQLADTDYVSSGFLAKTEVAADSARLGGMLPTSFAMASHAHTWANITNPPATATRWPAWSEVTDKPTTFTPSAHNQAWSTITSPPTTATRWPTWAEVTGKPTSFAPAAHNQAWSTITGTPAYTTRWPAWSEVTSKPTTFNPTSHTHSWANITNPPATATRWPTWAEVTGKPTTFPVQYGTTVPSTLASGQVFVKI